MIPSQIINDTINMMIKNLNLNLNADEIKELKEKALHEYCMKNGICYFRGSF